MLQLFKVVSWFKVNFRKSQLMGVNVEDEWLQEAVVVMTCKVEGKP